MGNDVVTPFVGRLGTLVILGICVGLLVLAVLTILLPVFVYRIHAWVRSTCHELERLNQKFDTLLTLVRTVSARAVPSMKDEMQEAWTRESPVEFVDDDPGYLAWLQQYSNGFVLNLYRGKMPTYMALHRATCSTIRQYTDAVQPGDFTEKQYIKVCATHIETLQTWARQQGRGERVFSGTTCGCPRS